MQGVVGVLICCCLQFATASTLHDLAAHIEAVHVVPTTDLVREVPHKETDELTAHINGHTNIRVHLRGEGSDWLDPKQYSSRLKSVIVSAVRGHDGPKMCVVMADSRHSLWDDSGNRHALFEVAGSRRNAMWLLPTLVNLVHAVQHGYDFAHIQTPFKHPGRHSAWLKLVAMRRVLPRYDYVLYLDSDTFFRQPGSPKVIENMVTEGHLDRGKIMAATKENEEYPDIANTGVVALRNCKETYQMLHDWWFSVVDHKQYMMYKQAWSFEQGAFTWVVYPAYNQSVSLLTLGDWNSPEGRHIQHIWSLFSLGEREGFFMNAAASAVERLDGSDDRGVDPIVSSARLVKLIDQVLAQKV